MINLKNQSVLSFRISLMVEEWANIYESIEKYYNRYYNKNFTQINSILKQNMWERAQVIELNQLVPNSL